MGSLNCQISREYGSESMSLTPGMGVLSTLQRIRKHWVLSIQQL